MATISYRRQLANAQRKLEALQTRIEELIPLAADEPEEAQPVDNIVVGASVFVKHGAAVTLAEDDTRVHPGDLLRVAYSTPVGREFALLHRDAQLPVYDSLAKARLAGLNHPASDPAPETAPR